LLLRYAIKLGIDINESTIDNIVKSRTLLNSSGLQVSTHSQVEAEINFWYAFRNLTELTKPITVISLKSTKENCILRPKNSIFKLFGPYRISSARQASYIYQIITLISIVFIVVVHAYGSIGTNLIFEIEKLSKQIDEKKIEKKTLEQKVAEERDTVIQDKYVKDKLDINSTIDRSNDNKYEYCNFLIKWLSNIKDSIKNEIPPDPKGDRDVIDSYYKKYITISKSVLLTIYSYVLPLLYGLLGASAYILRNLALEIKSLTYTNELIIHYNLRIALGTLSGLAIGWFYHGPSNQGDVSASATLSTLAMAFLAGYSVEILFATMDKLIAVFQPKDQIESGKLKLYKFTQYRPEYHEKTKNSSGP